MQGDLTVVCVSAVWTWGIDYSASMNLDPDSNVRTESPEWVEN